MMRLAYGQIKTVDRETMMNARQLGIDRVQFNLPYDLPADKYWKYEDLANFKERCDQYGVIVEAMENLPIHPQSGARRHSRAGLSLLALLCLAHG